MNYKPGNIVACNSFAGPVTHVKITEVRYKDGNVLCYMGTLLREEDIKNLRDAGVPYNPGKDIPKNCEVVVYNFQIIKRIRSKRSKNAIRKRKSSSQNK